ncbi:protein tramtrack, beta isoform-like [Anopheles ziemanni]|uniref:protein tramtrack, beta isoform-like n=1 Tax=Anopheles coustani TaxID=139045 RepID=UPI002658D1D3|nr:protein tramtrack, beta isoform-like [Anopheles coustani]XP_058177412.1 protein tramtrack, beta isoform-like [Anopheles ziemanni]
MDKKVCLMRHSSTFLAEINRLQSQGQLQDVTLSTGAQQIRLHKLVLAAASPYFRALICKTPSPQPIFTVGIPYHDLRVIVDALYQSKVEIPVAQLSSVLNSANKLQIRVLVQETSPRVPNKRPASRMEADDPFGPGSSRNCSAIVSSSTSPTPVPIKRPPSRADDDAQPGPSGLGRFWNRSALVGAGVSVAAELPNLVTMMQRTCVIGDAPQRVEDKMEIQPDAEIGKAVQREGEKGGSEEKMDLDVPNPKIARGSASTENDGKK